MLDIIISIFAIFGLAFLIKESDGPWGIMNWMRRTLMHAPYVNVFFFKLFECYFCVGCHAGWIIYLLSHDSYNFQFFIIWTLAGGAISLTMDGILSRLHRE